MPIQKTLRFTLVGSEPHTSYVWIPTALTLTRVRAYLLDGNPATELDLQIHTRAEIDISNTVFDLSDALPIDRSADEVLSLYPDKRYANQGKLYLTLESTEDSTVSIVMDFSNV